jgi:addiction module HigA family antidote
MSKKNAAQPVNPFHPGEILLEEFLQPGRITQAAFARKIGWTKARLNEFVRGRRGVTADAALDLGEALGISARLWKISRNGPARFRVNGPTLDGLPAEPRFESSTRPFSLKQVFEL